MNLQFKALQESDFEILFKWLQEAHVKRWRKDDEFKTLESIIQKYSPYIEAKNEIYAYIIEWDNQKIGFIQYYKATSTEKKGAGLDFYIGEKAFLNKGIGCTVLKEFLKQYVFTQYDFCLVDPDQENKIAIKLFEKTGFFKHSLVEDFIIMIQFKDQ
jgi:aminoglycoside 6'-N-acetyltransferase